MKSNSMERIFGILLVAASAAAFGTLAIFGRYAYADGMDALTILALRFSLSALALAGMLAVQGKSWPRGRTLAQLVGMGAVGYVGQAYFYFTALNYASSGLVALLLYLYPVFVTLLSLLWLKEPITRRKAAALVLATLGLALTVGPEGGQMVGILLGIGAAAIYSVYIMVGTQVMRQVSAIQSSAVIFASAGVMSTGLMLIDGPHWPVSGAGWGAIGAIVLVATALPGVAFLAGLHRIGASNAAMISTLEPVVTVALATVLLGEVFKPITLVGGGLILAAVLVLAQGAVRRRHAPLPSPALDEESDLTGRDLALLSEPALAAEWSTAEEDEAWSHLSELPRL